MIGLFEILREETVELSKRFVLDLSVACYADAPVVILRVVARRGWQQDVGAEQSLTVREMGEEAFVRAVIRKLCRKLEELI